MKKILLLCVAVLSLASCATNQKNFGATGAIVNFNANDFEMSGKKTAEATTVRIVGVDWESLFVKKAGNISSSAMPSSLLPLSDNSAAKAAYKLMEENPGYDVLFYPTVTTVSTNYIVLKTTKTTITGTLGRFKK